MPVMRLFKDSVWTNVLSICDYRTKFSEICSFCSYYFWFCSYFFWFVASPFRVSQMSFRTALSSFSSKVVRKLFILSLFVSSIAGMIPIRKDKMKYSQLGQLLLSWMAKGIWRHLFWRTARPRKFPCFKTCFFYSVFRLWGHEGRLHILCLLTLSKTRQ